MLGYKSEEDQIVLKFPPNAWYFDCYGYEHPRRGDHDDKGQHGARGGEDLVVSPESLTVTATTVSPPHACVNPQH